MITSVVLLTLFYFSHSLLAASFVKQQLADIFPPAYKYYRLFYTLLSTVFFGYWAWYFIRRHEFDYLLNPEIIILKYAGLVTSAAGLGLIVYAVFRYGVLEFTGLIVFKKML